VGLLDGSLLIGGGLAAGVFNTLAGGGSLLSVPLLILVGLPGTVANGTNRVGIFSQSVMAAWRFRAQGVSGVRGGLAVVAPVGAGALLGSFAISQVADQTFEKLFGVLMVCLLVPILWRPPSARPAGTDREGAKHPWPRWVSLLVFFVIGLYGGAFQAGVGIMLVLALSYAGYDLVRANSIKVVVNGLLTAVVIPVFLWQRQISWLPALLLASGYAAGGEIGARLAVRGGERLIRPVLVAAVVGLAGKMVGLY
jgi:uncharacterized protein